jgi:hypothetical protein
VITDSHTGFHVLGTMRIVVVDDADAADDSSRATTAWGGG